MEWLPGSTRAPCDEGLRKAVEFVIGNGMLAANPEERPKTAGAARELLHEALEIYRLEQEKSLEDE